MLIDPFQRRISYLRLSVTDRCNLRCRYCMPLGGVRKLEHKEILAYEEFLRLVRAAAHLGMTKIRLTGGEPLVRKGIMDFIRELVKIEGVLDLRLTTNGVLLEEMGPDLLACGIKRVNVSLDSLDPEKFLEITGRDEFTRVWRGVNKALELGFDRVKLNCVAIRGFNDNEFKAFADLSRDLPLEVRFIEFMPLRMDDFWSAQRFISAEEIMDRLSRDEALEPAASRLDDGPARVYRYAGAPGTIGFISAVTDHFCATCNRLRLTADGKIRACLLSNIELDAKEALRRGAGLEELADLFRKAVSLKPQAHPLRLEEDSNRSMNMIGG